VGVVGVGGGRSEICDRYRWRELGPGLGGPRPATDRPRCSLDRSGSGRRNGSTCPLLLLPLIPTPIIITTTLPMPLIFSSTSGPLSPTARTPPLLTTLTPRTRLRSLPRNRLEGNSNMFRYSNYAFLLLLLLF